MLKDAQLIGVEKVIVLVTLEDKLLQLTFLDKPIPPEQEER
jgi:hypothetical protein